MSLTKMYNYIISCSLKIKYLFCLKSIPKYLPFKGGVMKKIITFIGRIFHVLFGRKILRLLENRKWRHCLYIDAFEGHDKTFIRFYEIVDDATFLQMFGSFLKGFDALCLAEAQIKKMRGGKGLSITGSTFFLYKNKGQYFVKQIIGNRDNSISNEYGLNKGIIWCNSDKHRIVVPDPY